MCWKCIDQIIDNIIEVLFILSNMFSKKVAYIFAR